MAALVRVGLVGGFCVSSRFLGTAAAAPTASTGAAPAPAATLVAVIVTRVAVRIAIRFGVFVPRVVGRGFLVLIGLGLGIRIGLAPPASAAATAPASTALAALVFLVIVLGRFAILAIVRRIRIRAAVLGCTAPAAAAPAFRRGILGLVVVLGGDTLFTVVADMGDLVLRGREAAVREHQHLEAVTVFQFLQGIALLVEQI